MKANILNLTYDLIYKTPLIDDNGTGLNGMIKPDELIININCGYSKERQDITILHEAYHGYNDQLCLVSDKFEEVEAERFATLAYNFIMNNKDIIRSIID